MAAPSVPGRHLVEDRAGPGPGERPGELSRQMRLSPAQAGVEAGIAAAQKGLPSGDLPAGHEQQAEADQHQHQHRGDRQP